MSPSTRRGRPTLEESAEIDERIRVAALDAFVAEGFDGTTMEAIAAASGISRRTLYARYADKRELFTTVVPWALSRMPLGDGDGDGDPATPSGELDDALRVLARAVVDRLVHPDAVRLRRLALLEARRFPEFAEEANVRLWRENVRTVVDLLAVHADAGAIDVADVEVAADLFMSMVAGAPTILADLGLVWAGDVRERHVAVAVDLFLDGVRPRP